MIEPLTKVQQEILCFISGFITKNGIAPTLEEAKKELGYESISPIEKHIKILANKKYISKYPKKWRGIKITQDGQEYLEGL